MTVRETIKAPPFVLDDKRAIVKSHDHRGREQLGFGDAWQVWIAFALAPLAGGLTDSIEMRFIGGAYWYRVTISKKEALSLLEQEPDTEELRQMIGARYSLEASPIPRSRLRCQYQGVGKRCDREAADDWTTCKAHYDKGGPREAMESDEDPLLHMIPELVDEPIAVSEEASEAVEGQPPPAEVEEEVVNADIATQRDELLRQVWELERKLAKVAKGPGKTGPCPECAEEMGNQGGEYWHMREIHGKLIDYKSPTAIRAGESDE